MVIRPTKADSMRTIEQRGESIWIDSEPRVWFDTQIEQTLSESLLAEGSITKSSLYAGYRNIKIYGPHAIYVALGGAYVPSSGKTLVIEVGIPKATEKSTPDAQANRETCELILTEAAN